MRSTRAPSASGAYHVEYRAFQVPSPSPTTPPIRRPTAASVAAAPAQIVGRPRLDLQAPAHPRSGRHVRQHQRRRRHLTP